MLEVEQALSKVVTEIERLEGQRRLLQSQVDLATIGVELEEPGPGPTAGLLDPIREAVRDAARLLSVSVGALLYLAVFLSPWLTAAGLTWWIAVKLRRRRRATPGSSI